MKKIRRILSALIAVIFVVGCFSVSAFADYQVEVGEYNGHIFIAQQEAWTDYFCAALEYRPNCYKEIYYWIECYSPSRRNSRHFAIEDWESFCYTDDFICIEWYAWGDVEFCGFPISDFTLGITEVSHLYPGVTGSYIPEEADD